MRGNPPNPYTTMPTRKRRNVFKTGNYCNGFCYRSKHFVSPYPNIRNHCVKVAQGFQKRYFTSLQLKEVANLWAVRVGSWGKTWLLGILTFLTFLIAKISSDLRNLFVLTTSTNFEKDWLKKFEYTEAQDFSLLKC